MSEAQTAEAQWNSMSDTEKIEWLAVKVIGWKTGKWFWHEKAGGFMCKELSYVFSPLTDWNHWRQVEERVMGRVMEDKTLFANYIEIFIRKESPRASVGEYLLADLPIRARALFMAYQSLR